MNERRKRNIEKEEEVDEDEERGGGTAEKWNKCKERTNEIKKKEKENIMYIKK